VPGEQIPALESTPVCRSVSIVYSTEELHSQGDLALNEADFLDTRMDPAGRDARVLLRVLTLPIDGPEPDDRRVVLVCKRVGRVIASLRLGRWDDADAPIQPVPLDELSTTVRSFGGEPIYGWEFFDTPPESRSHWIDRLSLDLAFDDQATAHSLYLFQETRIRPDRILDLCIWFADLSILDPSGQEIPLQDLGDGARRWWAAMRARDPRVQGHGIVPGGEWPTPGTATTDRT
jgi:hypothetical protein